MWFRYLVSIHPASSPAHDAGQLLYQSTCIPSSLNTVQVYNSCSNKIIIKYKSDNINDHINNNINNISKNNNNNNNYNNGNNSAC